MAHKIQVILLENDPLLGAVGDIIDVAEGYARNFLFPHGKAALATAQARRRQSKHQARVAQQRDEELKALQATAATLDGTELTITARVKDGTEIFGKVTKQMICKELASQAGVQCTPADIGLAKPITALGSNDVAVRLSPDVEALIRVTVVPGPAL